MFLQVRHSDGFTSVTDVETGEIIASEDPAWGFPAVKVSVVNPPDIALECLEAGTFFETVEDLFEGIAYDMLLDDLATYRRMA